VPSEILLSVIVLPAATVQSATGFGYALLAAPLLVIIIGPALALPVLWLTFLQPPWWWQPISKLRSAG
jgi:hypothetical protein